MVAASVQRARRYGDGKHFFSLICVCLIRWLEAYRRPLYRAWFDTPAIMGSCEFSVTKFTAVAQSCGGNTSRAERAES
jgi:hypothetical protein